MQGGWKVQLMVVWEETAGQTREGRWSMRMSGGQACVLAPQSSQALSETRREMSQGSALPRDGELSN